MRQFLHDTYTVWYRDILRYLNNRTRIISSLGQPFLWLVIFGSGMRGTFELFGAGNFDFIQFLFPGTIAITVLFTAIFSSISTVRDREVGFLKEILVAPVSRFSIAIGKILGGATIALLQALLMLILAPAVGIKLSVPMILALVPTIFLVAFMISSFGMVLAARLKSTEGFQMIMSFIMMPLFMLSGAIFPLTDIPSWMEFLSRVNPVSYGVDLLRQVVFLHLAVPEIVRDNFRITVLGVKMGIGQDLIVVAAFAVLFSFLGTLFFSRSER